MEKQFYGAMLDMSRNKVMKPEEVVNYAKILKSFGYNMIQLYTEDTYEIENEPYFGYRRGRYSIQELQYIVDECEKIGMEVIPCIQTLCHLWQMFNLGFYEDIRDIDDILLIGEQRTYELIENMFKTIKKCFKSEYIHIGMDESFNVGHGKYLEKNGYRRQIDVILEHLTKVAGIAEKYGLKPLMWSDMFFKCVYGQYFNEDCEIPKDIRDRVPKNVTLVYWDYYHNYQKMYDDMLNAHQQFDNDVWFAGGAWCWDGFAPGNKRTLEHMIHGMKSAREHGVKNVFVAMWGDNGGECSYYSVLPALYACKRFYDGETNLEVIKKEFNQITGEDFDKLCYLDYANYVGGNQDILGNVCKHVFYSDLFNGIWDACQKQGVGEEYANHAKVLAEYGKDSKYKYLFDSMSALCSVMEIKYSLGARTRKAYAEKDMQALRQLVSDYSEVLTRIEDFYYKYKAQWYKESKAIGFDAQDLRIGGLKQRIISCRERLCEFIDGKISERPELAEPTLDLFGGGENIDYSKTPFCNRWYKIVSNNIV